MCLIASTFGSAAAASTNATTEVRNDSYGWWTITSRLPQHLEDVERRLTVLRQGGRSDRNPRPHASDRGDPARPGYRDRRCRAGSSSRRSDPPRGRARETAAPATSAGVPVSISSRTQLAPLRRRSKTVWISSSRSPASSSSTSRSASRVTRKTYRSPTCMPGNSQSRCAAITCSIAMKRSPSGSANSRGNNGGTFSRAKRRPPVFGSRTSTARFSDRLEMYGNGCAGSTDSGVRTGKIRSVNTSVSHARGSVLEVVPADQADPLLLELGDEHVAVEVVHLLHQRHDAFPDADSAARPGSCRRSSSARSPPHAARGARTPAPGRTRRGSPRRWRGTGSAPGVAGRDPSRAPGRAC